MPDKLDRAALFEDPSHLLSALHMLIPADQQYPDRLLFIGQRGWAIDRDVLGDDGHLTKLAEQHGWKVEFQEELAGRWMATAAVLDAKWTYHDPLQFSVWGDHTARPLPEDSAWAWLDPQVPHHEFLLGAKDQKTAQRILDVIHALHTQGIRLAPILVEPLSDETCPWRYFWSIFLAGPNPFAFDAADRVWWGPVGYGRVQIFLEYPWSLAVPIHDLHRMPWAPDIGIVLLSKNDLFVVEIRLAAGGKLFSDYPGVVKLTTQKDQVSEPIVASQSEPEVSFKVAIRLGGPDPNVAMRKRIEELRTEIFGKQRLLEHMLDRGDHKEPDDLAAEPLFLYAQTPSERGRIPTEIQRLLLEWADQPEDLESISYAFLPAEVVPKGLFIEGSCVHIITSATALGRAGAFATGPRMLDYTPKTSNSWNLTLDPDWTAHGLRLFTPAANHVWLYPNLRPSPSTATRLASAMHRKGGVEYENWLYLLLPALHTQIHFLLLPINAFKPLSEAFQWVLDIDAGIDLPKAAQILRGSIGSALCEAIDVNLSEAVQKEATDRLDTATARLKSEVAVLESLLNYRDARLKKVQVDSIELDNNVKQIGDLLDDVLGVSTEMTAELQRMEDNFQTSGTRLESLHTLIDRYSKLRQKIHSHIAKVTEIRNRWLRSIR